MARMRRVYGQPQFSSVTAAQGAVTCPREACGALLAEEEQPDVYGRPAPVMFCTSPACDWREWSLVPTAEGAPVADIDDLIAAGLEPREIARRAGRSLRTVYRRQAEVRGGRPRTRGRTKEVAGG